MERKLVLFVDVFVRFLAGFSPSAVCTPNGSFTNSFSVSVRAQMSVTIAALGLTAWLTCIVTALPQQRAAAWCAEAQRDDCSRV